MIKGQDVIGLKVISLRGGREIDDVQDIIYSPSKQKVLGLLVDRGGWFRDAEVILIEDVRSIGEDAVMIETGDVVRKASYAGDEISSIMNQDKALTKMKIVTETGTELGELEDIYFDPKTGQVGEFEVSEGLVKDVSSGKKYVNTSDILNIGKDVTIVKAYTEQKFDAQSEHGGLKGAINKNKTKAPGMLNEAKEKVREVAGVARAKAEKIKRDPEVQETMDTVKMRASLAKDEIKNTARDFYNDPQTQQNIDRVKEKAQQIKTVFKSRAKQAGRVTERKLDHMAQERKQDRPYSQEVYAARRDTNAAARNTVPRRGAGDRTPSRG